MGSLYELQAITLAAGLEAIRAQLRRARRAADMAGSERLETANLDNLTSAISEATEALTFVAAAVTTPGGQLLIAEAAEAMTVLTQLAQTFARHQQHQSSMASVAAIHAAADGNPAVAFSAGIQAQEAAGLALWAARMGGLQLAHETAGFLDLAAVAEAFQACGLCVPFNHDVSALGPRQAAPGGDVGQSCDVGQPHNLKLPYGVGQLYDLGRPYDVGRLAKRPRMKLVI
ncbi:hypothetical protein VOLCADRAFT_93659 [Volvox carteri f. nagariensis]|uniref:Uncharacterized protein n=1 Tax=Volvox carteri f. nagariensis TaxID=3068 RepID=D8U2P6_VOLCA|nr:uncharacterized protein VOLCADRAFT_93659 [Volvox carteri f. nagariensis]EFJ45935.1 hypothetical protein VOLCADRAFT_93659 [Volvox carteri f. nagariensis]|eukprot:XP_002953013.1 hypothetical protein VOLCADRAFT_93659 [Volvox carteri f. nagariensis]